MTEIMLWLLSSFVAGYCVASLLDATMDPRLAGFIERCWHRLVKGNDDPSHS
jgi:hypothetical protein